MSRTNEAIEQLLGIVSGMMADDDLDNLEIEFLQVWLADNADVSQVWPGSAIARAIDTVLADGHVSEDERAYLSERDSFYLATVSATGWPYVQFRGGPPGFLQVIDDHTLGWADFRGNLQYISTGNAAGSAEGSSMPCCSRAK